MRVLDINLSLLRKNFSLFFFLFIIQLIFSLFIGYELYPALVVFIIVLTTILIVAEPSALFYLLIIITNLIEGKYLEVFVLFRLFGFNWYVMDLVLLSAFLSILIRLLSGDLNIKNNAISNWLILFLGTCLISVFVGLAKGNQIQAVLFDFRVFMYYLIFFPSMLILKDFSKLKSLFYFVLAIGTIKCLFDIIRSLFLLPRSFDDVTLSFLPFARLTGYSEVIYPMTLVTVFSLFFFQRQIEKKIILTFIFIISLIAVFLSYTRGSWLAVFITIIIASVFLIRSKRIAINWNIISMILAIIILFSFISTALGIISFDVLLQRLFSVTYDKIDISNLGRLVEYVTAVEAFLTSPMVGAGFGFYFEYFSPGIGYLSTIYCHNSYLYILSKMGIIGFVPFIMLIIYSISVIVKILKSKLEIEEISIVFSFLVMLLFLVIKSFTTWHLNTVTFSLFVGLLFGISSIYYNKLRAK